MKLVDYKVYSDLKLHTIFSVSNFRIVWYVIPFSFYIGRFNPNVFFHGGVCHLFKIGISVAWRKNEK